MRVNVHQAITQLSKLIAAAEAGEEVVIARGDKPVVKMVAITPAPKRQFGAYKGQFSVGPEFFDPLPDDELALWNCE
jgi:antitoxin (DNA-binding transcriptional repressor) of toxin-antitoxin stability system